MPKFENYAAICSAIGRDPQVFPETSALRPKDVERAHVNFRWEGIVEAYNGTWEPDWSDTGEYKHSPYAYMNPSGFGLHGVAYFYSYSGVASRLCFRTEQLAKEAIRDFPEDWKAYMTIQ